MVHVASRRMSAVERYLAEAVIEAVGSSHRPTTEEVLRVLRAEIAKQFGGVDVVLLPRAVRIPVVEPDTPTDLPPPPRPAPRSTEYELPIEVRCEVTGHPLPRVPFVVQDEAGRIVHQGTTDAQGRAVAAVRSRGQHDVIIFPTEVTSVDIVILGDDGLPLKGKQISIADSTGAKQSGTTEESGSVSFQDLVAGPAHIEVDDVTVPVFVDPLHERTYVVRAPGCFGTEDEVDEFAFLLETAEAESTE